MVLRKFNLHLGARGLGTLGKDVEDEAGAVQCLDLDRLLDKSHLLGGKVIVKDDEADVVLLDKGDYLFEFSLSYIRCAVRSVTTLQEGVHGNSAGCLGEEFKFVEVFFGLGLTLLGRN